MTAPAGGRGLSPRVRGNRGQTAPFAAGPGSIPACAGEPRGGFRNRGSTRVYPRVCGGTHPAGGFRQLDDGLSPRVRGNLQGGVGVQGGGRSIPACAGEPSSSGSGLRASRVYPRVCGGTGRPYCPAPDCRGLSPRVRGNPGRRLNQGQSGGSIPACAGEPRSAAAAACAGGVYPRVCGGTSAPGGGGPAVKGLSPRVRGNPPQAVAGQLPARSIPACAGEPILPPPTPSTGRVYPRVCGGTVIGWGFWRTGQGLSPRVRGNRPRRQKPAAGTGSIPACAGEPAPSSRRRLRWGVYPRVCGGTPMTTSSRRDGMGLSPRVRGNHVWRAAWR